MKKVITALGNPKLNTQLKNNPEIELLGPDILYQEGVIEKIENYKQIDILILSELLPGKNNFLELVSKIKEKNNKIEIIIILGEKNEQIKNRLIEKGIFNIFYNNEITTDEILKIINKKEVNSENIKEELDELKKIILENKSKKSFFKKINKKLKIKEKEKNKNNKNKIKKEGLKNKLKNKLKTGIKNIIKKIKEINNKKTKYKINIKIEIQK